jgi:hypothetical protein
MANLNRNNGFIRTAPNTYWREQSTPYGRNSTEFKINGIGKGGTHHTEYRYNPATGYYENMLVPNK